MWVMIFRDRKRSSSEWSALRYDAMEKAVHHADYYLRNDHEVHVYQVGNEAFPPSTPAWEVRPVVAVVDSPPAPQDSPDEGRGGRTHTVE